MTNSQEKDRMRTDTAHNSSQSNKLDVKMLYTPMLHAICPPYFLLLHLIYYYFHSRPSGSIVQTFWTSIWWGWALGYSCGCIIKSVDVLISLRVHFEFNLLFYCIRYIYILLWHCASLCCYNRTKQLLLYYQTSCFVNRTTLFCKVFP